MSNATTETTVVSLAERMAAKKKQDAATHQGDSGAASSVPAPPEWLTPRGKKHWPELYESLQHHKIINELDTDVLAIYCSTIARFIEADIELETSGMTQQTQNGYQQLTAAYVAWRDLSSQVLKFAKQLGLTPPARVQMKLGNPDQSDLFEDL